jgi:hypothetical protein
MDSFFVRFGGATLWERYKMDDEEQAGFETVAKTAAKHFIADLTAMDKKYPKR